MEFDQEVYTIGSGANPSFDQPVVRLGYTSLTVPSSVYDYDVRTRELTLLRRTPVLGGYDPEQYEEHRVWAPARDGELVPVSLVCRRGRPGDGPLPTLLYGYGAYEASIDPYFSPSRLSLLDRGAAFAIAHVRGGGEMGRRWYDQGKLEHKENSFHDFVDAARHLVETGWSSPDTLVAEGGSAGGLLVGAALNEAPELFAGVVAAVPFVDTLTTMLDASLPLTVGEYDEWGNPRGRPGGLRPDRRVRAVRQRGGRGLPAGAGRDLAERHPGALRGAGQVGGPAARDRDRSARLPAAHRDVGRPRRRLGSLQGLARPGVLAGLDPGPDGAGRGAPRPRQFRRGS